MDKWVAIAGHYDMSSGNTLEVKPTRLKNTGSREGLVLEMIGGKDPFRKQKGVTQFKQKAIIELLCNREKTGWEPIEEPKLVKRDDKDEEDGGDDDTPEENVGSSLKVISYGEEPIREEIWGILKLQWETKYACEDSSSIAPSPHDSSGWGFFTWMIIMCVSLTPYLSILPLTYQKTIHRNSGLCHHGQLGKLQPTWGPWF
jgi:hypothetical protein